MPEYLEIHWIVKSMPEYLEIHWIVKSIRGKVSHFIVKCVSRKGKEFTNEECKKAENLRLFLEELPEEFEILSVEQRGKEVALICESFVILIQSFGQGSYLYYLDHEWNTSKEPFQSDGFLIFEGINKQFNHYGALVLIDCRTSHHQFVLCKRPLHSYWSKKKGPCILNEPEAFIKNLKNALENEPITFKNHSIAWILLNQKYFHGIGEYTASEILFRLYKKYGIKPFDNSWKVLKNPVLFDAVICAPRSYYEESKSFGKKFNPACVGRKQKIAAKHFRLNFLRVYGKKVFRSQKIVPVAFKLGGDFHTVYMLQSVLMNSKVLPSGISKSKKRPEEASKLPILDNLQTLEQWHVVRGKRFTKKVLFVGPFEWHLQGEIPTLRKNGLLVNKFDQKGPKETPAGPHHRKRKNPRSGHKAEKLKQHKHFSTSTNKIE